MSDIGNKSKNNPADKLWGGRFTAPTNEFVEVFTASVGLKTYISLFNNDLFC